MRYCGASFQGNASVELRQHTAVHQGAREIISNRLVLRQIDGALSGDDGRKLLIRQATLLTDEHMGVKLVSRLEMRTGDEDRDFPYRLRQRRLVGQRPDKVPASFAENRLLDLGLIEAAKWVVPETHRPLR